MFFTFCIISENVFETSYQIEADNVGSWYCDASDCKSEAGSPQRLISNQGSEGISNRKQQSSN